MEKLLNTDTIYLREFKESDWKDVYKYASQEMVCKYQAWGPINEQEAKEFIKEAIEDSLKNPRNRYPFAVIYKKDDSLIGSGEIFIHDFANRKAEIGYVLNPDYWGKGIATEAAELLIEFGFKHLKLHRIFATCDPRNAASAKVLEKAGMTLEGRIRDDMLIRDGWRDSFIFGILENEWERK